MTTVEIFSQGEEVLTGLTVDSNAAWLSQQLVQMGFSITRHSTVGDKLDDLVTLLQEIAGRADCCICSGGLGPTVDDLTAEAVAKAFALPLQFDQQAFRQIQQYFEHRNRPMPAANRKQAMIPRGAQRLDNHWGTAPGFALQHQRCWFAFVPGVPYEMRCLFSDKIRPMLQHKYDVRPSKLVTIKSIGIGESDIQQRIQAVTIPVQVQLSFCAGIDEVQTKLLFAPECTIQEMQFLTEKLVAQIGDYVFTIDGLTEQTGNLAQVVAGLLDKTQRTLAVIETASQGLLAAKLIDSHCVAEALYAQSILQLYTRLGLEYGEEQHAQCAVSLAVAMKRQSRADYVIAQLYGPDRDALLDEGKKVTLYNVLVTESDILQNTASLSGPLARKQNQAALSALDLLRRNLQNKEI